MAMRSAGQIMDFGAFLKIHVRKFTIESGNGVTNTAQFHTYLNSAKNSLGMPGSLLGFSYVNAKESYVTNEVVSAKIFAITSSDTFNNCYRYRNGALSASQWNNASYDAKAVAGTEIYIYTYEWGTT